MKTKVKSLTVGDLKRLCEEASDDMLVFIWDGVALIPACAKHSGLGDMTFEDDSDPMLPPKEIVDPFFMIVPPGFFAEEGEKYIDFTQN